MSGLVRCRMSCLIWSLPNELHLLSNPSKMQMACSYELKTILLSNLIPRKGSGLEKKCGNKPFPFGEPVVTFPSKNKPVVVVGKDRFNSRKLLKCKSAKSVALCAF